MASRSLIKFVDSIVAVPGVLLDLNQTGGPLMVGPGGIDLSPPPIRRSIVAGFLGVDGDPVTATAPGNRTIKVTIQLVNTSAEQAATAIQNLSTRLQVDGILMIQLDGMTKPIFFLTYAAPDYTLAMLRLLLGERTSVTLEIPAMAYGLGEKVTLPAFTVYNDPTKTTVVNTNPFFESDASGWGASGGTVTRSTAQFHQGVASGLLTPDGVTANSIARTEPVAAATQGQNWRFTGWLRCAVARTVILQARWYDVADAFLSSSDVSIAVSANTWTFFSGEGQAPVNTQGVRVAAAMTGTPPGSNLLFLDEVILFKPNLSAATPTAPGGMCLDVTGVLGDVETPLFLSVVPNLASPTSQGIRRSAIGVRRRGIAGNAEWVVSAESMSLSNQTTVQPTDPTASGPPVGVGLTQNFVRTDFATTPTMALRLNYTFPQAIAGKAEGRGSYNVYARVRHSVAADTFTAMVQWGTAQADYTSDTTTIPAVSTAANWFYVPLATIALPPGYDPEVDGYSNTPIDIGGVSVLFSFARATGTGTLDIDFIMFLPADDRVGLIDWHTLDNGLASYVLDGRRNQVYALDSNGRVVSIGSRQVAGAFPMVSPGVTNRIYFVRDIGSGPTSTAGAGSGTGDNITASTVITPSYFPRYRVIRPAAT